MIVNNELLRCLYICIRKDSNRDISHYGKLLRAKLNELLSKCSPNTKMQYRVERLVEDGVEGLAIIEFQSQKDIEEYEGILTAVNMCKEPNLFLSFEALTDARTEEINNLFDLRYIENS